MAKTDEPSYPGAESGVTPSAPDLERARLEYEAAESRRSPDLERARLEYEAAKAGRSPELSAALEIAAATPAEAYAWKSPMAELVSTAVPTLLPSTAEPSTAEPSTAEPPTAEPSTAEPSTDLSPFMAKWLSQAEAEREREELETRTRAIAQHRWLALLLPEYGGRTDYDDPEAMARYPAPDWDLWCDFSTWDVVTQAIPLLMCHDPDRVHEPPYLHWHWCFDNLTHDMTKIVRVVLENLPGFRKERNHNGGRPAGSVIAPTAFLEWAITRRSLLALSPARDALDEMRRRLAPAVQPATAPVVQPDDEVVPLPSSRAEQVRRAFVVFTSMQSVGVKGLDLPGASQRLIGTRDETVERYIRDGRLVRMYDELMAWAAKRDDRWPRIWAAFRSEWKIPAEIKGSEQDRTE